MPTIAGTELDRGQVLELANTLARNGADFTSRLLLDAITYGRDVVSLNADDREQILAAIADAPPGLDALRDALMLDNITVDVVTDTGRAEPAAYS